MRSLWSEISANCTEGGRGGGLKVLVNTWHAEKEKYGGGKRRETAFYSHLIAPMITGTITRRSRNSKLSSSLREAATALSPLSSQQKPNKMSRVTVFKIDTATLITHPPFSFLLLGPQFTRIDAHRHRMQVNLWMYRASQIGWPNQPQAERKTQPPYLHISWHSFFS